MNILDLVTPLSTIRLCRLQLLVLIMATHLQSLAPSSLGVLCAFTQVALFCALAVIATGAGTVFSSSAVASFIEVYVC